MKNILYSMLLASLVSLCHVMVTVRPKKPYLAKQVELTEQNQCTLESNDGQTFQLTPAEASLIPIIKEMGKDVPIATAIPIPYDGDSIELVLLFLHQLLDAEPTKKLLRLKPDFYTLYTPSDTPGLVREALKPFLADKKDENTIQKFREIANFLGMQWLIDGIQELQKMQALQGKSIRLYRPDWKIPVWGIADLYSFDRLQPIKNGELNLSLRNLASIAGIEVLPDSNKVTTLNVSFNLLQELPESIESLKALERLKISNNHVTYLPSTIGNLSALTTLDVSKNRLRYLTNAIGNLKALKALSLENNQLTELPDTIVNLQSLEKLSINGNRLSEAAIELLEKLKQQRPELSIF